MPRSTSIYLGAKLDDLVGKKAKRLGIPQGEYMRACLAYCTCFLDDFDKIKAGTMISYIKVNCDETYKEFVKKTLKLAEAEPKRKKKPKEKPEPVEEVVEEEVEEEVEPEAIEAEAIEEPEEIPSVAPDAPFIEVENVENVEKEKQEEPLPTSVIVKPVPAEPSAKDLAADLDLNNPIFERYKTDIEKAEDAEIRRYIDMIDAECSGALQTKAEQTPEPSPSSPRSSSPRRKITYSGTAM